MNLALKIFHRFGEFHVAGTMAFVMAGAFAAKILGELVRLPFNLFGLLTKSGGGEVLSGFAEMMHAPLNLFGFTVMTTLMVFFVVMFASPATAGVFGAFAHGTGVMLADFFNVVGNAFGFLDLAGALGCLEPLHQLGNFAIRTFVPTTAFLMSPFWAATSAVGFPFLAVSPATCFALRRMIAPSRGFAVAAFRMVVTTCFRFLALGVITGAFPALLHEFHQATLAFGRFGFFRFWFVLLVLLIIREGGRKQGNGKSEGCQWDQFLHGGNQTRYLPCRFQRDTV